MNLKFQKQKILVKEILINNFVSNDELDDSLDSFLDDVFEELQKGIDNFNNIVNLISSNKYTKFSQHIDKLKLAPNNNINNLLDFYNIKEESLQDKYNRVIQEKKELQIKYDELLKEYESLKKCSDGVIVI